MCWNVIHGVAELDLVLRCSTSQAVARDGVELELNTILNWEPVEVSSDCSRDRIIFANSDDQTCSRISDRLETVKEIGTVLSDRESCWRNRLAGR